MRSSSTTRQLVSPFQMPVAGLVTATRPLSRVSTVPTDTLSDPPAVVQAQAKVNNTMPQSRRMLCRIMTWLRK
ncbi:MAG: hypothetical protein IH965_14005 [Gemmatimonadetes bacterium]|nr:hypothetical protein [Gemmatimonadota bacterium]